MADPPSDPSAETGLVPGEIRRRLYDRARASGRISWLLDECIRIPGTKVRFGLDPILGLIPYGGETAATVIGAFILGEAGRKGLPHRTLLRMGANMLLNAGIGAIPVVGDLFSFWFKSNTRNYRLLDTYLESEHGAEARGGWWPFFLILAILGMVFFLNVVSWLILGGFIYQLTRLSTGSAA